jgi:hypothetical protein
VTLIFISLKQLSDEMGTSVNRNDNIEVVAVGNKYTASAENSRMNLCIKCHTMKVKSVKLFVYENPVVVSVLGIAAQT